MPQAMGNGTPKELKTMEIIIEKLQTEVDKARESSNNLRDMVSRLSAFTPNCDTEKGEVKPESPEGAISMLYDLIDSLKFTNRRNGEILNNLNSLV